MNSFNLTIKTIAMMTVGILLIPLIAMQFSSEVNWGFADFATMGALLFGAGLALKLITEKSKNYIYRMAFGLAIGTTFFLIWANLAVGLIGAGTNLANLMYIGVIGIVIFGSIVSRARAVGMERTMHGAAFAVVVTAAISLVVGLQNKPSSSVSEILIVSGLFAGLYITSAIMFRLAQKRSSE